jgi:hypothetical protein
LFQNRPQVLNSELTENLFEVAHVIALDLAALNIQRGKFAYKLFNNLIQCLYIFLIFSTQTVPSKLILQNSIAMFSAKKLITPWRESNPGLLFLKRIRCPLRHADRGQFSKRGEAKNRP